MRKFGEIVDEIVAVKELYSAYPFDHPNPADFWELIRRLNDAEVDLLQLKIKVRTAYSKQYFFLVRARREHKGSLPEKDKVFAKEDENVAYLKSLLDNIADTHKSLSNTRITITVHFKWIVAR